jgi:hypothetical protein
MAKHNYWEQMAQIYSYLRVYWKCSRPAEKANDKLMDFSTSVTDKVDKHGFSKHHVRSRKRTKKSNEIGGKIRSSREQENESIK